MNPTPIQIIGGKPVGLWHLAALITTALTNGASVATVRGGKLEHRQSGQILSNPGHLYMRRRSLGKVAASLAVAKTVESGFTPISPDLAFSSRTGAT